MNRSKLANNDRFISTVFELLVLLLSTTGFSPIQATISPNSESIITPNDLASGDAFGNAIAIDGNTAIIGACTKSTRTGVVYVYIRSGSKWVQQAELTGNDSIIGDSFGFSVALSGDTAVIGASGKATTTGAAYIFTRSGSTWSQQAKLTAPGGVQSDAFGIAVAINGDTVMVGASGRVLNGAVYVFTHTGSTWDLQSQFTSSDIARGDLFGASISINGNSAVIGAWGKNSGAGAAYIFNNNGNSWIQQAKITASDAGGGDYFGYSVGLSGMTAVVGAYGKANSTGAAYTFVASGTSWSQQAKLTAGDALTGAALGKSVTISGDTVAAGAPAKFDSPGASYIFNRANNNWNQQTKLSASDSSKNDQYGASAALSANVLFVGAIWKNNSAGAVYAYDNVIPPSVTTSPATAVSSNGAVLNGNLASLGSSTSISVSFEYGITTAYGSTSSTQVKTATESYGVNVTDLLAGTTYHFSAKADGGTSGIALGQDASFTTLVPPTTSSPVSTTLPSTTTTVPPASTSTVLTTSAPVSSTPPPSTTPKPTTTPPATTSLPILSPPAVSTSGATAVGAVSATLDGTLDSLGSGPSVSVYFEYGTSAQYGLKSPAQTLNAKSPFSAEITGLSQDKTYHFRFVGESPTGGTSYGSDVTFNTGKSGASFPIWIILVFVILAVVVIGIFVLSKKAGRAGNTQNPMATSDMGNPPMSAGVTGSPNLNKDLQDLEALRTQGAISDKQYNAVKKKLMKNMSN